MSITETTFAPPTQLPVRLPFTVNTSTGPAVVTPGDALLVFYKGLDSDPGIYVSESSIVGGNLQWTSAQRLPQAVNTNAAPAALVDGGLVYVFYRGAGSDQGIYVVKSSNGTSNWQMSRLPDTVNTTDRPDVTVLDDTVYVLYKGAAGDQGIYAIAVAVDSLNWRSIS